MPTKFSPEVMKLIESDNLEEAKRLLNKELLETWSNIQRKKIDVAKKWLK